LAITYFGVPGEGYSRNASMRDKFVIYVFIRYNKTSIF